MPSKQAILEQLGRYGYGTTSAQTDQGYRQLIRAVQLHFRPQNYDGTVDIETAAVIYALTEKYMNDGKKTV